MREFIVTFLAAILCTVSVCVLVYNETSPRPGLGAISKIVASLSFLWYAAGCGVPSAGTHGLAAFVGLVLSALGDVLLISKAKRWFLAGLGSFLLAHVAYASALLAVGVSWTLAALAVVPFAFFARAVWRWLEPHVGRMRGPVAAYVLVICSMAVMAIGALGVSFSTPRLALGVGAVVFVASDLCVARNRFVSPGPINRQVGLPLYYVAQIILAWGFGAV